MLPKPEKTKKNQSIEQLDLVESISAEDKLKKKRHFLLITLFATVGLSFIFWTFHFLQTFSFSNFQLPSFSFSLPQSTQSVDFDRLLSPNSKRWHVSVAGPNFQWSYNSPTDSTSPPTTTLGIIKNVLPEGVDIKESLSVNLYSAQIVLPQGQFLITIKYDDNNPEKFKSTIPIIVETLYWSLLKSL